MNTDPCHDHDMVRSFFSPDDNAALLLCPTYTIESQATGHLTTSTRQPEDGTLMTRPELSRDVPGGNGVYRHR